MLLIGNGRVVTGNQEQPLIEDGSVVLNGNTVLEVGNYRDLKENMRMQLLWMQRAGS